MLPLKNWMDGFLYCVGFDWDEAGRSGGIACLYYRYPFGYNIYHLSACIFHIAHFSSSPRPRKLERR